MGTLIAVIVIGLITFAWALHEEFQGISQQIEKLDEKVESLMNEVKKEVADLEETISRAPWA